MIYFLSFILKAECICYEILLQFNIAIFYFHIFFKCSLFLRWQCRIFRSHYCRLLSPILQKSFLNAFLMFRKHFVLFSILKTVLLLNTFVDTIIFKDSFIIRILKKNFNCNTVEIFSNVINVFTAIFDQFNVSLVN